MEANVQPKPKASRTGPQRTGGLLRRGMQYYARFRTEVDGEIIRVVRALGTDNRQVAKAKLTRLLKEELPVEQASNGETFEDAARRLNDAQRDAGATGWKRELARMVHHIFPVIGPMPVEDIRARHVNDLLEGVTVTDIHSGKEAPPSLGTLKHVLNCVSLVLDDLWRKEVLPENVARRAKLPKAASNTKERAVLSDFELARYLAFTYKDERAQVGLLQRQTMSCIARLFGGVRTGDLHAMRWESFDTTNGRFEWGYAPRAKSKRPQRLTIDPMLQPILRRWWEHSKRPREGLVFPVLTDGKHGKAGEGEKHQVSHAHAMRRDLRRAFGIDKQEPIVTKQKNGREMPGHKWVPGREMTPRERELLKGTKDTLPVDFHSWRRAYCQALADAGVNAQLAKALAGHASEAAHEKYLRSSEKARALPEQARPQIDLSKVARKAAKRQLGSR